MKIQGNLATYEFSDLLQWLAQGNKTGILKVSDGGVEYHLGFDHGRIDMSSSSDPEKRLDNYLYGKGVIDDATLARAARLRDATKMMSGQVLVTLGAVTEVQLAQALREKTEEILCELLTWDQGSFQFEGGERPEATMVPISMEVTKLLLESMHRLDQQRGGKPLPDPQPVTPSPTASPPPPQSSPEATQVIDGLALAEILDPEEPPAPTADVETEPATEEVPEDLPPHYAVMTETPGPLRRLLPYALVGVLSLMAATFYVANRDGTAQAADIGPAGEPILFTRTAGPPPTPLEPAEPAVVEPTPAPATAPTAAVQAADLRQAEEALRQRYEEQLAGLRRELEEARQQSQPATQVAQTELPADSMLRATAARPAPPRATPPATERREPASTASAATPLTQQPAVIPAVVEPSPPPLPAVVEPPAAEAEAEETVSVAPDIVNPKLVTRPLPRYPPAAQRYRRGAKVVMRVLIGIDGRVEKAERDGAKAGLGFDRAAEEAALASTWKPGTRDGEPTPMWAELHFEFIP